MATTINAAANMHKKQVLQQEIYHLMLHFPKDHLIKERADAEDEDAVFIMVVKGAEEGQDAVKKSVINIIN
eukprot:7800056-Ditylum_brightwellii.AAC.1